MVGIILLAAHAAVLAHAVSEADGLAWRRHWSWEPWVVACLSLSAVLYAIGAARLWARAGTGRGVSPRQTGSFVLGWVILVLALLSPLDALGNKLFSAHMIQHELLMIAAAPLLVVGRPLAIWVWALPFSWRRAIGSFFHAASWRVPWLFVTGPMVAWLLHALALWLWHIPALFEAALRNEAVHTLQHISFLGTALIFWWSVLGTPSRRASGLALLSIFTTMVHTGALGAILTLSRTPWYSSYADTTFQFGVTPLQDQQIGGLVMWVPTGFVYIACGLAVAIRMLNRSVRPVRGGTAEAYPS
ncbi:MAG: cytochrome c oxidase assembly protein [Pseudomonadota bacterium]|nr:cytochrome c oxidase assembly protein [Pseudomonadota bacterium]